MRHRLYSLVLPPLPTPTFFGISTSHWLGLRGEKGKDLAAGRPGRDFVLFFLTVFLEVTGKSCSLGGFRRQAADRRLPRTAKMDCSFTLQMAAASLMQGDRGRRRGGNPLQDEPPKRRASVLQATAQTWAHIAFRKDEPVLYFESRVGCPCVVGNSVPFSSTSLGE